jgi:hypothetical protein
MRGSIGFVVGSTVLCGALAAIGISTSVDARADTNDVVIAEVLFRDGRSLLEKGDSAHACPKLMESFRLDPASGTLLALALCHEREGKFATAWAEYADVASRSKKEGRDDRAAAAHAKAVEFESKLSSLTIVLADDASQKGIEVRRNGAVVPTVWLGTAVPVDGGAVKIEATAPHVRPWHTSLWIDAAGDRRTVTIPSPATQAWRAVSESQDSQTACAPTTTRTQRDAGAATDDQPDVVRPEESPPPSPANAQSPPPAERQRALSGWRVAGLVTGAVAIVGLGVGGLFGVIAMNRNEDSKSECLNGGDFCTAAGQRDRQDAVTAGNVSTTAFIGGGVLAVAGTSMFLWGASSEARPTPGILSLRALPTAGPNGVGGVLLGSF